MRRIIIRLIVVGPMPMLPACANAIDISVLQQPSVQMCVRGREAATDLLRIYNSHTAGQRNDLDQSDQRYDSTTIWLHWLTVALVAILWILGQVTGWLPRGPFRLGVWSTHVVLGLILALVLAMRILWRAGFGSALQPADAGVLHWLAKGTHYALYLLLVAVVILGIANASYMGFDLYGVLTMPRFGSGDPVTERSINTLHEWVANLLVLIAVFHAAAALGHQFIWRDRLLQRLRPRL